MRDRLNQFEEGEAGFRKRPGAVLPALSLNWSPIISAASEDSSGRTSQCVVPDVVAPPGACSVIALQFHGFGFLPVVLVDGRVAVDVLEWIKTKSAGDRAAPSTLYRHAHSIQLLIDYYRLYRISGLNIPFMNGFFETRVQGNAALGWPSVFVKTAKHDLIAIEQFFDWYCEEHALVNPNPIIEEPLRWGRVLIEAARRYRSDLLAHLFFTTKASRTVRKRVLKPSARADRGRPSSKPSKSFQFEHFVLLVRHEPDPGLRMLWLQLGAAGLRRCEALQQLLPDISCNRRTGECEVLLADPIYGPILDPISETLITRKYYLQKYFNAHPREEELLTGTRFVGWKGMRFQEGNTAGVTWLHPYFGRLAWKSHVDYLEQRSSVCGSRHPWYFVNTRKFLGEPLSWGNLSQLFATRCRRLGIPPPHNVHSLRHMYVNFLLHVLGLSLAQAQVLVRHVSQESTANYATTCKEMTRRSLERLARDHPAFINYPEFGSL